MSRWFAPAETACRCGCGADLEPDFLRWLDGLREAVGRPLRVTSGRRCARHDAAVGGRGPHVTGLAVDLAAADAAARHALVVAGAALGARGIGVGNTFIHLDRVMGPARPALWTYPPRMEG